MGRADLRANLLREFLRVALDQIGDREKIDRRMLGGKPRAQRADAAGTDDRDSQLFAFDDVLPAARRSSNLVLKTPENQLTHAADCRRVAQRTVAILHQIML